MNLTDYYSLLIKPAVVYGEPCTEFFKPAWYLFEPGLMLLWALLEPFTLFLYNAFFRFFAYIGVDLFYVVFEFILVSFSFLWTWCRGLLIPVIFALACPWMVFACLYLTSIWLQLYKAWYKLYSPVYNHKDWHGARMGTALFWMIVGKVFHGYEVFGLENVPVEGPAIICYYHGAIPIDFYFFMSAMLIDRQRQMVLIVDNFMQHIPGFKLVLKVFSMIPGSVPVCKKHLEKGRILAISPGGVREAFFSDNYYQLQWGKRLGFAKVAVEAKVPIIPIFTQNCREGYRSLSFGRKYLRYIYEKTRLPIVPIYGGFPAKMRAFVGKPIPFEEGMTPEEFAKKARDSVEALIRTHQQIPGNIFRAITERFIDEEQRPQVEPEPATNNNMG